MLTVVGDHEFTLRLGLLNAELFHELAHAIFAQPDAPVHQFLVHARPVVSPFGLELNGVDVGQHGFVATTPGWRATAILRAAQPVEIPTGTGLKHFAGNTKPVIPPHLVCPGVPRCVSCAKYAAIFCDVVRRAQTSKFRPQLRQLHLLRRDHVHLGVGRTGRQLANGYTSLSQQPKLALDMPNPLATTFAAAPNAPAVPLQA